MVQAEVRCAAPACHTLANCLQCLRSNAAHCSVQDPLQDCWSSCIRDARHGQDAQLTARCDLQAVLVLLQGRFVGVSGLLKTLLPFVALAALALYFARLWALISYVSLCVALCSLLAISSMCYKPN